MENVANESALVKALCEAIGLQNVRKLVITMEVDQQVSVTAEFYPDVTNLDDVMTQEFELQATRKG